jgi:tripartite-type tricarboxylate transporter receptor subunit TctC
VAVTSAARNKSLPNVPALSEFATLKGAESDLWYGMLAPGNTDRRIIESMYKEIVRVLSLPAFKERFEPSGTVLVGNSPDVFAKLLKNDYDRWGKVIRAAGTTAE